MATPKRITDPEFNHVIVIGTSAGGLKALTELISQLQAHFPAPILIVQHISADATGNVLLDILNKTSNLTCEHAVSGSTLLPGHLYMAPSDHHLMIDSEKKILITKGAQENRNRPAIDPLFRSAAVAFGTRLIGIILTGYLNDGSAGLQVIKRCGGTCIVQDPDDAEYPAMPMSALRQVKVDYCLPIAEMGGLLYQLIEKEIKKQVAIPKDILVEAKIAERVLSDLPSVNVLGKQVPFNCPGCGGVLWEVTEGGSLRYRCHVGHAYTASYLLAEQTNKIEETMWTALRMFEERKNLLTTMAGNFNGSTKKAVLERADTQQIHIDRIRAILQSNDKGTIEDMPI